MYMDLLAVLEKIVVFKKNHFMRIPYAGDGFIQLKIAQQRIRELELQGQWRYGERGFIQLSTAVNQRA